MNIAQINNATFNTQYSSVKAAKIDTVSLGGGADVLGLVI